MARTALAAQTLVDTGITPTYVAANAQGHYINPGDVLHVKNGGVGSINVTLVTGSTVEGHAVADTVVAVPNGQERMMGGLTAKSYAQSGNADEGRIYVDFSGVTSVTVAAFRQ